MGKNNKTIFQYIALITQLGLSSITPIILGVFFGGWLDKKIGSNGFFSIIFLVLGAATAIYNIYKLAGPKEREKKDE